LDRTSQRSDDAIALLERASGRTFGKDANAMYVWLWYLSDLRLLRDFQRIIYLNTEVADGALKLCVAE